MKVDISECYLLKILNHHVPILFVYKSLTEECMSVMYRIYICEDLDLTVTKSSYSNNFMPLDGLGYFFQRIFIEIFTNTCACG